MQTKLTRNLRKAHGPLEILSFHLTLDSCVDPLRKSWRGRSPMCFTVDFKLGGLSGIALESSGRFVPVENTGYLRRVLCYEHCNFPSSNSIPDKDSDSFLLCLPRPARNQAFWPCLGSDAFVLPFVSTSSFILVWDRLSFQTVPIVL